MRNWKKVVKYQNLLIMICKNVNNKEIFIKIKMKKINKSLKIFKKILRKIQNSKIKRQNKNKLKYLI